MEQLLFMEKDNSFESFLKLCHAYYISEVEGSRQFLIDVMEKILMEVKIDKMNITGDATGDDSRISFHMTGHFLNKNKQFSMELKFDSYYDLYAFSTSCIEFHDLDINRAIRSLTSGNSFYNVALALADLSDEVINKDFTINDQRYNLSIDFPKDGEYHVGKYIRIRVRNGEKIDIFYYDMTTCTFYINLDGKLKLLNSKLKEQILSVLPSISFEEIGSLLGQWLKKAGDVIYVDGTNVKKGTPSTWKLLFHGDYPIGYRLLMPEREEVTQDNSISLSEFIAGSCGNVELGKNAQDIRESIKRLLSKLKDQEFDRKTFTKIRISEELFFISVTPNKKEIDPFFKDPKIMELCDLSKIDFTNAAIAGFSFEGTGAKIVLSKVFDHSIKGTNLRGIQLWGQDLNGIVADEADVRDTGVSVSIETASIVGTKFSSSSSFMSGTTMISDEDARMMGINIEETEETKFKMPV